MKRSRQRQVGLRRRMNEVSIGHCCFCGTAIDRKPDPCRLRVQTTDGEWRVWRYHETCFQEWLGDGTPLPAQRMALVERIYPLGTAPTYWADPRKHPRA